MERILVSMNCQRGAWGAWSRAISLTRRIDARLYALLVLPPTCKTGRTGEERASNGVKERLELQIELAKSEGIRIDYFISEGSYEEEVIRFVEQNRITLLVAEPPEEETRHSERELSPIRSIGRRIRCRMELVSPRKIQNFSTGESNDHEHSTPSVSSNCGE